MSPFIVEEVRRGMFDNRPRYAGGSQVSGLWGIEYKPGPYDITNDASFQGECPNGYEFEGEFDPSAGRYGHCRKLGVAGADGPPAWVVPVASVAVLAAGAFFLWKAVK